MRAKTPKPKNANAVSTGTRLEVQTYQEAAKLAENSGIRMADLLRIGLTRLLADVKKNGGKLILGKNP